MAESDTERLKRLYKERICPYCGKQISESAGVGSGRVSEGRFCSLDCYAKYYEHELAQRHLRHLEKIKIRALLVYGTVFRVAPRVTYNEYAPLGTP